MTIHWKHIVKDDDSVPSTEATLKEKATLVGRIGQMMLSVGTGAWRVRNSMNEVARTLGISCTADIGLLSIEFTCYEESGTYTHSIALPTTGVNTDKLNAEFVPVEFEIEGRKMTALETEEYSIDRSECKDSR